MIQTLIVEIDSTAIEVSSCTVTEKVNRFYDVAVFQTSEQLRQDQDVHIEYGDRTFDGFVYTTTKISASLYSIECRTEGAKLTEPYQPRAEVIENATTSHDVCALYTTQTTIPINITAEEVDFGGSYERNGTMLSALQNIANITGAEYWQNQTGAIEIQPNKAITTSGTEIPPSDIFDFVATKDTVYNKGVGFITVQNGGSETEDIISKNGIYAEIDECSGEIFVFPNPYGTLEHTEGISPLIAVELERKETVTVLDDELIRLDGAIESITSITLNGTEISDYNFVQEHNVVYFDTSKRGILTIIYKTYCLRGYTNVTAVPLGRFISLDIFYLDQLLRFAGLLSPDCLNSATDGDMTCIVPNDLYYNQGFNVYTIGGDPEFILYDGSTQILRTIISTSSAYTSVEGATLEETATGYRYRTRYPIDTANGAQSGGEDVPYTTSVDGDDYYFEFTRYYPRLEVSYDTSAMKHYVQFSEIEYGVVTLVVRNGNTEQVCEYDLDTKIPCELDQYIPVSVDTELGLAPNEVVGRSVSYTKPDGSTSTLTVDSFGNAKVYVDANGEYVLDTDGIKDNTSITLTANV